MSQSFVFCGSRRFHDCSAQLTSSIPMAVNWCQHAPSGRPPMCNRNGGPRLDCLRPRVSTKVHHGVHVHQITSCCECPLQRSTAALANSPWNTVLTYMWKKGCRQTMHVILIHVTVCASFFNLLHILL